MQLDRQRLMNLQEAALNYSPSELQHRAGKYSAGIGLPLSRPDVLCNFVYEYRALWHVAALRGHAGDILT